MKILNQPKRENFRGTQVVELVWIRELS